MNLLKAMPLKASKLNKFITDAMNIYVGTLTFTFLTRRKPNGYWKKDRIALWKPIRNFIVTHNDTK